MAAPINDLSRGCSVSDIINVIAITANQAAGLTK
jgi:phosphate acetyltransferase